MNILYEFKVNGKGVSEIYYDGIKLKEIITCRLHQDPELSPNGIALVTIKFHAKLK